MQSLLQAIECLYTTFCDVPKPHTIEGCFCCINEKEIGTLLTKPLRELDDTDLSSYASSAFLTVGQEADYLYFLPRIVHIACTNDAWWPSIEVIGRAIGATSPLDWPEARRDALIDVIQAVIAAALAEGDGEKIDEWICAAAKMGLDVEMFLGHVAQSPQGLIAYFECNSEPLAKGRLGNAFWEKNDPWHPKIVAWFSSARISSLIREAYGLHMI